MCETKSTLGIHGRQASVVVIGPSVVGDPRRGDRCNGGDAANCLLAVIIIRLEMLDDGLYHFGDPIGAVRTSGQKSYRIELRTGGDECVESRTNDSGKRGGSECGASRLQLAELVEPTRSQGGIDMEEKEGGAIGPPLRIHKNGLVRRRGVGDGSREEVQAMAAASGGVDVVPHSHLPRLGMNTFSDSTVRECRQIQTAICRKQISTIYLTFI